MTTHDLKKLFPNASASTFARNADQSVGALADTQRKPAALRALERHSPKQSSRKRCLVRVLIVSCRRSLVDDDNLVAGAKPLRDCIATGIGLDDGDPRIRFEYAQVKTTGAQGTQVIISDET